MIEKLIMYQKAIEYVENHSCLVQIYMEILHRVHHQYPHTLPFVPLLIIE